VATERSIQEHLWAIVLAGGEGERLRPLTQKWLGCHCPKQYCTFVGSRSMLQHTLDRTYEIVPPDRVLTVVSCDHMKWLEASTTMGISGPVIRQPANLDTGPGVFLPVTYILAADPSATVLIFPSDHFIFPRGRFLSHVTQLVALANRYTEQIVVIGAKPDRAETDYGWIEPGQACAPVAADDLEKASRWVTGFWEKPSADEAQAFLEMGYLWNTMIMAAAVKTLWRFGNRYLPEMMSRFELLLSALEDASTGSSREDHTQAVLSEIYRGLRPQNFSRGLLQRAAEHTVVAAMDDVDWDDWGRPVRIVESLARIGRRPAFSIDYLAKGDETDVQNKAFANA
jgi:mannose-1-phosphate guanylyltransferase